jgi:hypothetical protein
MIFARCLAPRLRRLDGGTVLFTFSLPRTRLHAM